MGRAFEDTDRVVMCVRSGSHDVPLPASCTAARSAFASGGCIDSVRTDAERR